MIRCVTCDAILGAEVNFGFLCQPEKNGVSYHFVLRNDLSAEFLKTVVDLDTVFTKNLYYIVSCKCGNPVGKQLFLNKGRIVYIAFGKEKVLYGSESVRLKEFKNGQTI
jgi:hypothetical protein